MARWEPDANERLRAAALALFDAQGYDATTVAQIADAAGLTKRTFFRYFTDKREVLFDGSQVLIELWVGGVAAAPSQSGPLEAVSAGLDAVAAMFADRHAFARRRARVISAHPELQERELIKLQTLAGALTEALARRGVPSHAAALAAQVGVTVFHVAFARWVAGDDQAAFRRLLDDTFDELRSVTAR